MDENKRDRKAPKRDRKRLFNAEVYKLRFVAERSFAWIDKFKALLISFDRKDVYFLGVYFIAFTMIYLCHVFHGMTVLNRGVQHHCLASFRAALDSLPRRFGGYHRGGGTLKKKSSATDQRWSVNPAAMAGVRYTQR